MESKKITKVDAINELEALRKKMDALETDNARLRQSNDSISGLKPIQDMLMSEMDKLGKRSRVDSGKIKMKVIDDHTNIRIYHTNGYHIGKFVGPLHPANAEVEMKRFARRGIMLSVDKPTDEEIEKYKTTDEYIRLAKAFDKVRSRKVKTKRTGEFEKLALAIEKLSGQKVVNAIADSPA